MKRIWLALLVLALVASLALGCAKAVTVDDVLAQFDQSTYYSQKYGAEMMEIVRTDIAENNIALTGDLVTVVHLIDNRSSAKEGNVVWAYVYEFAEEADAEVLEKDRRAFMEATDENGACVRFGKIVVFGNAPVIATMDP